MLKNALLFSISLLALIFHGCVGPNVYKVIPAHIPLSTEKNEVNAKVSFDQCFATEASYSITEHIGVSSQYYFLKRFDQRTRSLFSSGQTSSAINIQNYEGGIFYYLNLSTSKRQYLQISLLYNSGIHDFFKRGSGRFAENEQYLSSNVGYAIQPAYYVIRKNWEMYYALKFQKLYFDKYLNSRTEKEIIDFRLNMAYIFTGFSFGGPKLKVNFQLGFPLYTGYDKKKYDWRWDIKHGMETSQASIGVSYRLNLKRHQGK